MIGFLRNGEFYLNHSKQKNKKSQMDRVWIFCLLFWIILDHSSISALHDILAFNTIKDEDKYVPNSIGQEAILDLANSTLTSCDYNIGEAHAQYHLEMYPVMYNGEALFGWVNVKIAIGKGNNNVSGMRWSVGQGRIIERRKGRAQNPLVPGEFIFSQFDKENAPDCFTKYEPADKPYNGNLSKKHFVPGLYTADPYPTVPYGFGYSASRILNDGPIAFTLNWRLNFPFCGIFNSALGLYYHFVLIPHLGPVDYCDFHQFPKTRDIIFQDYVSGAHDPDPPKKAKVDCSKSLADLQKENKLPKWISKVTELYIKEYNDFYVQSLCSVNALFKLQKPKVQPYEKQLFFGRCQYYNTTKPIPSQSFDIGFDKQHYCESQNNDFWINLPEQGEIITNNSNTNNTGAGNCKHCNEIKDQIIETGISADSAIGKRVFSYRRGHGLFMIIGTIFFMTVSHFGAHFYKETFFNKRIINFHVWYTIHVNGSIMAMLCFFVGMFAAISAHLFLGYSKHIMGLIHVVLGWISIAVFVFVFITSGIRMRSPKPRIVTIFLHYLGGGFSYILNILCLASSCYIPASPSGRSDIHMPGGFKFEFFFLVPLIVWILFDLGISIAINFCMLSSDKRMRFKKKRKWALFAVCGVAIPMLRPYSKTDLEGTKLRKILLIVYFFVASLLTIALVVVEMTSSTKDRYFGPMTYSPSTLL